MSGLGAFADFLFGFGVLAVVNFAMSWVHGRHRRAGYLLALRHVSERAVVERHRGKAADPAMIALELEQEAKVGGWW